MAGGQQGQRPRQRRDAAGVELDLQRLWIVGCVAEHFTEVAQQPEAGDVGGGMELARMVLLQSAQLLHQRFLAGLHLGEGGVEILGAGGSCQGRGEQHAGAEGTAEQQLVASAECALGPEGAAG